MKILLFLSFLLFFTSCKKEPFETEIKEDDYHLSIIGMKLNLVWKAERFIEIGERDQSHVHTLFNIVDDRIIIGRDNMIELYNKNTGELIWKIEIKPSMGKPNLSYFQASEFLVENSKIFFIHPARVTCLRIDDGSILWESKEYSHGFNTALRHNSKSQNQNYIFISSRASSSLNQKVIAISKLDGSEVWSTEQPLIADASYENSNGLRIEAPYYCEFSNTVYVSSFSTVLGSLIAIDAETGEKKWETKFFEIDTDERSGCKIDYPISRGGHIPCSVSDGVLVRSGFHCYKYDFDGNFVWHSFEHNNCEYGNTTKSGQIYKNFYYNFVTAHTSAFLTKINPFTGDLVWSTYLTDSKGRSHTTNSFNYTFVEDVAYILTDDYWIYGINTNTGEIVLNSSLARQIYTNSETGEKFYSGCFGGFAVEGERIYYLGNDYLFCAEIDRSDD
jgi:outer membrane protein assembly factor BamB